MRSLPRWLRRLALAFVALLALLAATLAMPVNVWRTGRQPVAPLRLSAPPPPRIPLRLWIDTDAACGHSPRTDVDDCLALWLLSRSPGVEVAGISTVFGNAPLEATDRITGELTGRLPWRGRDEAPPVATGLAEPFDQEPAPSSPGSAALVAALKDGALTVLALGPLSNVAAALAARPDLRSSVRRVVAVMGRRPGHLFHPAEGSGRGGLPGHGPVFRDFNFAMDPRAARTVLAMGLPVTLIPYDAARRVEITGADLDALAAESAAGAWIASRSRGWLEYWREDVGRSGFYPFDLMAAVHLVAPEVFRCAEAEAWIGTDPLLFLPFFRAEGLLVDRAGPAGGSARVVRYCPQTGPEAAAVVRRLLRAPAGGASNAAR